jgi:sigma-B regulation protein RsbQ
MEFPPGNDRGSYRDPPVASVPDHSSSNVPSRSVFMTSKAATLNVSTIGDGPFTVVLGNGIGTSQQTWRYQVDALKDHCRIVMYDYVGTPDSDVSAYRPERYDTLYGHADDVIALLDEMDLRDVIFVGHSVSGMIGSMVAIASPDRITQLVTIGASPRYLDDKNYIGGVSRQMVDSILSNATVDYHTWVSGFSPMVVGEENAQHFVDEFSTSLRRMRPDIANQTLKAVFNSDFRDILPRVKQPVTVIQPRTDPVVPVVVGEYLTAHYSSATLYLLATTGHLPHLTAPDKIANVLREVIGIDSLVA